MAQQFGNTWWGSEWLRSLTYIDYANRIPRGARYARNGSVREIQLQDNVISAKVQGSRPRPYRVKIVVPKFSAGQVDKLMDRLVARPGIISGLLNRELDPEVMDIARSCGLKIFPERWDDLEMDCSCPDWAVPCKHLAAVIYMFSREIDNNPFIVFQMHGVDLLKELKKRGIEVDNVRQEVEVPALKDLVTTLSAKDTGTEVPAFRRIDFSRLADRSDALLMLLPDKPPFAPQGNFKEGYVAELRRIKKNVQRFFSGKPGREELFPAIYSKMPESIGVDDAINLSFDYRYDWKMEGKVTYDECTLPHALLHINPDFLQRGGGSSITPVIGQELPGALDARLYGCASQGTGGCARRTRSGITSQGTGYGAWSCQACGASCGMVSVIFPRDIGQISVGQW